MNSFGPILAGLIEGAIFLALVGIIVRGRVRYCWSFTGYLATVFTGDLLVIAWPNIFFTPEAWMVRQSVYGALKMGIAAELAATVFAAFPGAKARARRVLFLMLIVTASMMIGTPRAATYEAIAVEWYPRILSGTIWLMTGIAILVVYYRIPLDRFHRAILTGFVPYHIVCVTLADLGQRYGLLGILKWNNVAQPAAYLILLAYWTGASWRRDEALESVPPALLQMLHPWRARARA